MAGPENVSTDDLRQVLAEVERKKPAQRLMVAINYLEADDLTQKEVAERYGYTGGWLSRWLDRLERLADEPFEQVVTTNHDQVDQPSFLTRSMSGSSRLFTNHPKKSVLTRPRGLSRSQVSTSPKSSTPTTATVTSGG